MDFNTNDRFIDSFKLFYMAEIRKVLNILKSDTRTCEIKIADSTCEIRIAFIMS